MKKRLLVFVVGFMVVLVVLVLLALFSDHLPRRLYSSPTEARIWAQADYDANFVEASKSLPLQPVLADAPPFDLDTSTAGKIEIHWEEDDPSSDIHLYGERIEATKGSHEVTLSNGQVLRLIAFAHSPGPQELPAPTDTAHPRREGKVDWRDPLTLEPIAQPETLNLPLSRRLHHSPELFLAFTCSDVKKRPVRWHYPRVFNDLTRTQLNNSLSREAYGEVLVFNCMEFHCYHSAPLRISMPLSYGETEILPVDESQVASFEFKKHPALLRMLHADKGYLSGSSWRGSEGQQHTTYHLQPAQGKSQRRSFTIFSVWPAIRGNMIERFAPKTGGSGGRWSPVYANSGLTSINHAVLLAELQPTRYRQFPRIARGIFSINEIPGLPKPDNLFDVTMGPLRIEYENDLRRSIEQATSLRWVHSGGKIPDSAFPLDFPDPATTPAQMLKEYERLTGSRMAINQTAQQIVDPTAVRRRSVLDKIMSFLRRLF